MRNIKKSVPYKTSDKSWYYQHCLEETYKIFLVIIQQIVTLSKYGHDALDICHP